ncbi:MAG: SufD family Fe-S cluster assembly protein [Tidjanibacter sp.]|nr:SufD family Fe-S cluster assembly protein [Tidjanibacter sp.]
MATSENITVLRPADSAAEHLFSVGEGESLSLCHIVGTKPSSVTLKLAANASAKVLFVAVTGTCSKLTVRVDFEGRGASIELYGLFLAAEGERREVVTEVRHNAGDCKSFQTVKGVASGSGAGRFDGLVYVAPDAQHTDAEQLSRNLLLGNGSRIETLPQLEIYADDVRCSHGATVGQLADEAIYYMRQRGINEQEARRLQMSGFAHEIVSHCSDEKLLAELTELIDNKIEEL